MEINFEKKYHDVETNHWWFKSRRSYLKDLIKNAPKNSKILDIGCSSGVFLKDLETLGFNPNNLFGIDISAVAISNSKQIGLKNTFVMDAQEIILNEKFDLIIASDCLEHLQDDEKALKNWNSLLNNNGMMYVFVPAFKSLWSYHDVINQHFRRYTKLELKTKLENQGLQIQKASYWNFFLFIPIYLFRQISSTLKNKNKDTSDIAMSTNFINKLLTNLIEFENKLLRKINFPFGVSTFCIAKKSDRT